MKTQQAHIEPYMLHYQHKSVHRYFRSLNECIEYIFTMYEQTNIEPQKITLPNGDTIIYNVYAISKAYLAKGCINERQLIQMLKIPDSHKRPQRRMKIKSFHTQTNKATI